MHGSAPPLPLRFPLLEALKMIFERGGGSRKDSITQADNLRRFLPSEVACRRQDTVTPVLAEAALLVDSRAVLHRLVPEGLNRLVPLSSSSFTALCSQCS